MLSIPLQLGCLALFFLFVYVFIKLSSIENRLETLENHIGDVVTKDDFVQAIRLLALKNEDES